MMIPGLPPARVREKTLFMRRARRRRMNGYRGVFAIHAVGPNVVSPSTLIRIATNSGCPVTERLCSEMLAALNDCVGALRINISGI